MSKAVVLLSAGLDSSYNLFRAHAELEVSLALTFDYGQRAAPKEIESATALSQTLGVPHRVINLKFFAQFTSTALVGSAQVPTGSAVSIDDLDRSRETMKAVWVPNRNGIFLNIAAGFAEGLGADFIIPGFNKEEAATFPDNSEEYMTALDAGFRFSTRNHVKVKCFSSSLNKTEIVKDAARLTLPLAKIWPCYFAGPKWCGQCESCQRFNRAVREAGVEVVGV